MRVLTLCAAVVLVGCATSLPRPLPDRLVDLPWTDAPVDRMVVQARQLQDRGCNADAARLLDRVLHEVPGHVDAQRLRQDLLRARGRTPLLRSEVAARLQADDRDGIAWYLRGRLLPRNADKVECFRKAIDLAPTSLWPWLGLAYAQRDERPAEALAIYERLYASSGKHPVVAIAYADLLQRTGAFGQALQIYLDLRANTDVPGTGDLGLARTLLAMDKRVESWEPFLQALRVRPFDDGVRQLVGGWLRAGLPDEQLEQIYDVLREDPQRLRDFGNGEGGAVLAALQLRLRQLPSARASLERLGVGPRSPALRREYRRLLLAGGDLAGALAVLRADFPAPLLVDERNQVRGVWIALLRGPWYDGEPLRDPAQAAALVTALADVGLLAEAEQVAELALLRWPGDSAIPTRRDEVRRELAFEDALRRMVQQGYAQADPPGFDALLEQLRAVSVRILGRNVVDPVVRFSVPIVGEMLDPFATGLCRHVARYNKHLVLGHRSGGVAEGLLLARYSVSELEDDADQPLPGRCFEVVGGERELRSLNGVAGGDVAGIALLNHYVVDLDAVRDWSKGIADHRQIAAEDQNAMLTDPMPGDSAPGEALDVTWRLAVLSPVQDSALEAAVFDMIRRHERRHLVDSFHYLPVEDNLWRGLGLLLRFGLSATAIEGEMERRAELAALALSPHTELVLGHIADFLGEGAPESPHVAGFTRLAADLDEGLVRLGMPEVAARPARWHEADGEAVRKVARELLDRLR